MTFPTFHMLFSIPLSSLIKETLMHFEDFFIAFQKSRFRVLIFPPALESNGIKKLVY